MKILVADTYYNAFVDDVYRRDGLRVAPYAAQLAAVLDTGFGHSDAYSDALVGRGHEVVQVLMNVAPAQAAWAREAGVKVGGARADKSLLLRIFEEQVRRERPHVVYVHDITFMPPEFAHHIRTLVPRLVAQTACPVDFRMDHSAYDLIVTSFPHYVDRFRLTGVAAEFMPLAFDGRALAKVSVDRRDIPVVFVGGVGDGHASGRAILECVAAGMPLDVWGYGADALRRSSPLLARHHGPLWGWEMFGVLARSRVVLNRHVDAAAGYANNMRLFEATGIGACLLTDAGKNLGELFEVDSEVVTYDNPLDALDKARYLIDHQQQAQQIAEAGQRRTLADHTYDNRVGQLLAWFEAPSARRSNADDSRWKPPKPSVTARAKTRLAGSAFGPVLLRLRDRATRVPQHTASTDYVVLGDDKPDLPRLASAWKDGGIPTKQRALVEPSLQSMRRGKPPEVFDIAARAVAATGLRAPSILEVGCSSGYYNEVLRHLVSPDVSYVGADYSVTFVRQARKHYPGTPFVVADGSRLPFADNAFDIVLSGCVLLHMPQYRDAIAESFRTARGHVVFHRTPVLPTGETTWTRKKAYGVDVVEIAFGERELYEIFEASDVDVIRRWTVGTHDIPGLSEQVEVVTYLCRARTVTAVDQMALA